MFAKIPWLSIGRFTLIVLCLAIVLTMVVMVLPVYLDITAIKGPVEEILSGFVEAPVTVGEIRLHPSPWPTLRMSDLEIGAAGGNASSPLSRIDDVEIKISLPALLRDQVRLQRLLISGATLHAHRPEGQGGNWPVSTASSLQIKELEGIELENVTLELDDHQTVRATLVIDHLTCDIAGKRPLDLNLEGSLEGLPFRLSAAGPTLAVPLSQASDFPLAVVMDLADLHLELDGSGSREPGGTRFQVSFGLASRNLTFLHGLTPTDLPQIGGFELSGQLSTRRSAVEITQLRGSIASTPIRGRVGLDWGSEPLDLTGRLALGDLDLTPWLQFAKNRNTDSTAPLRFDVLANLDADLELGIEQITGFEFDVSEIALAVDLEDGVVSMPATLRAADIPVAIDLRVRSGETPEIDGHVRARDLTLRELDPIVKMAADIDGSFGTLDFKIASSGDSVDSLGSNLRIEAEANHAVLSLLDEAGERPIEINLTRARAVHRPESPLAIAAEGELLQEAFTVELRTAPLAKLIGNEHWPLEGSLLGAGARIDLQGFIEKKGQGVDFEVDFGVYGQRLGDLERWLGIPNHIDHPYDLQGRMISGAGTRLIRFDESSIGGTRFTGEFARNIDDKSVPFMADLQVSILDLRELQTLTEPVTELDTEQDVLGIDLPLLPSRMSFHDAEIEVAVDRLVRKSVDLRNVDARFHFQEGKLARSPFSFEYETQRFDGEIDLDLRGEIPLFRLDLHGDGENLGEILQNEGIVEDVQVVAKRLDLTIDAAGSTLRKIIRSADLSGQLVDVQWQIEPEGLSEPIHVHLDALDLRGPKGKPIVLTGSGSLEQEPLDLTLTLRMPDEPRDLRSQTVPIHLAMALAATNIELDGDFVLPITKGVFALRTTVEGESLATLSPLLGKDLPNLGPYRLSGDLGIEEEGFSFENLDLLLGESDLHGEIHYHRVEGRPGFTADLQSLLIRTEDLIAPEPESESETEETGDRTSFVRSSLPETIGKTLTRLKAFDVNLDVSAEEIRTAGGPLKNLVVTLDLDNGNLDLKTRRPQADGDDAQFNATIRSWGEGIDTSLQASWHRQPYGLFGDIFRPGAAQGVWSLDLDLDARGASLQELAASLSGHLDLADYPVDYNAALFDLWGGGLLNSILPVFHLGSESRINCAVARFQVEGGVLSPDLMLIDSTRSRVRGKGTIDLPGNRIDLRLKPRPKQRNLINLSTPVRIQGPLTDPDVRISKGGLAVTFFRFSLWVYTVWRDMARQPLPADGRDVCLEPFVAPREK